ncbi:MAG: transposase [Holophaga sp.]|nr:transposase [Holophaga sp.]
MGFTRPRFDVADIVRLHRDALEVRHSLNRQQRRVLTAIGQCRTAALGGHKEVCEHGDFERLAYNSCRNRHCPKCQALAQERWLEKETQRLLDVGHFHLVFTLPAELRFLAKQYPAKVYGAFFHAVTRTLLALGKTRLKATLGLTLVLHTWTRELTFHPHLHVLATAGGLALDGSGFIHSRKDFLFPVAMMGVVFRAKMLHELGALQKKGSLPGLQEEIYATRMATVSKVSWVVYAKKPFRHSSHVAAYISRYTHRVGIANSRLLDVTDDRVTFTTRNGQATTIHPVEFLHRLVQHVLPQGFRKIRHAGMYGSVRPGGLLARARAFVGPCRKPRKAPSDLERLELTSRTCPICGGALRRTPIQPTTRAPPEATPC